MTLTSNHMVLTQVIDSSDDDCQIVEEVDIKATVDTNKNKGIMILRVPKSLSKSSYHTKIEFI